MNSVIVVPIYKEKITKNENISLQQCLKIFSNRIIYFILPEGLKVHYLPKNNNVRIINFGTEFFKSIKDYNRLMLSYDFYNSFCSYDYILIYQLDAFVFRDELDYWSSKGFDYIGAPWFNGAQLSFLSGNGGFSLRKVSAFLKILSSSKKRMASLSRIIGTYPNKFVALFNFFKIIRHYYSEKNNIQKYLLSPFFNEDHFYSEYGQILDASFKVADPNTSIAFSFEVNPKALFKLNGRKLPFGCHAFEKYDPEFWHKYILF